MRKQLLIALIITLIAAVGYQYLSGHTNSARVIRELEIKTQELDKKIHDVNTLESDKKKLEEEKKLLEAELQAKRETDAVAAAEAVEAIVETPQPVFSGSHEDWMAQAGISPSDYGYVDYIVEHESSWRVTVTNSIGAHGLCQSLPGDKMATAGADWYDNPVTQLRWCNSYASSRYGSWAAAYQFWINNRWW